MESGKTEWKGSSGALRTPCEIYAVGVAKKRSQVLDLTSFPQLLSEHLGKFLMKRLTTQVLRNNPSVRIKQ